MKRRAPEMTTVAICTGCHFIVLPGPRLKRRIVRHLRTPEHNHDACVLCEVRRDVVPALRLALEFIEGSPFAKVRKRLDDILTAFPYSRLSKEAL